MKFFTSITLSVALLILAVPIGYAQTPDGQTPANEGVCDVLQGHTPGLYGLCVAFCEAQDYADISMPITEEELLALKAAMPSGKILDNYNKRKKETDPPMPCIKVEEPCPCWDSAEFDDVTYKTFYRCTLWNDYGANEQNAANIHTQTLLGWGTVAAGRYDNYPGYELCVYQNDYSTPLITRQLYITVDEELACEQQIRTRIADLGVTCTILE
jgi:hypothetical protein